MQITASRRPKALVLCLSGRLDALAADSAQRSLLELLGNEPRVVLDLHGVDYISSAGIRVLLVAAKTVARQPAGCLAVACPTATVRRILCDSGLDECLGLTDNIGAFAD